MIDTCSIRLRPDDALIDGSIQPRPENTTLVSMRAKKKAGEKEQTSQTDFDSESLYQPPLRYGVWSASKLKEKNAASAVHHERKQMTSDEWLSA